MPTVLRIGGLRVVIYPNDHQPPHVHVIGNGCEAIVFLNCPEGPPNLRENYGFSQSELGKILIALQASIQELCEKWSEIHG